MPHEPSAHGRLNRNWKVGRSRPSIRRPDCARWGPPELRLIWLGDASARLQPGSAVSIFERNLLDSGRVRREIGWVGIEVSYPRRRCFMLLLTAALVRPTHRRR